jgi:hypothetical protein
MMWREGNTMRKKGEHFSINSDLENENVTTLLGMMWTTCF